MLHRRLLTLAAAGLVPCVVAPGALAAGVDPDLLARKAAAEQSAAAASSRSAAPIAGAARAPRAARARVEQALAGRGGRVRVLVGARRGEDVAAVRSLVARHARVTRTLRSIATVVATTTDAAALVAAVRADRRVAWIEPDRRREIAAEPFDAVDPETGIKYDWAFDVVRAGEALAQVGGRSKYTIAVIDTGVDVTHRDLAGNLGANYDAVGNGGSTVTDYVGHGTFVSGLISAVADNGIGLRGVAGSTPLVNARASIDGSFTDSAIATATNWAVRKAKARILNFSLGGEDTSEADARQLEDAYLRDVLPIAAAGNEAQDGNPIEYPAALIGGTRGGPGIGLSVGATKPDGQWAEFSSFNDYVSVAAPGAGSGACGYGVISTIPDAQTNTIFDSGQCLGNRFSNGGSRFAYSEGTSFAAPIASGVAALAWQAEPKLASEQVAEVVSRSARQSTGSGWNQKTGRGIVDALGAVQLARTFDITDPKVKLKVKRTGRSVVATASSTDRTSAGRELAGRLETTIYTTSNKRTRKRRGATGGAKLTRKIKLPRGKRTYVEALVCDGDLNCVLKRSRAYRR